MRLMRNNTRNEYGIFYASNIYKLIKPFEKYLQRPFLDLGSGDGRVVMLVRSMFGYGDGVEIDNELFDASSNFTNGIIHNNIFNIDLSKYNSLYYYTLGCKEEDKIIEKINKEFNGTLILKMAKKDDKWNNLMFSVIEEFEDIKVYKRKFKW